MRGLHKSDMGCICTCARAHLLRTMVPPRPLVHHRSRRHTGYERSAKRGASLLLYTGEKSVWAAGRPAVVTLFERLFLWNGMTNSRTVILIRCHHPINHVFDRYRYPPVSATARGTCRGEGVEDTLSLGNSTTAGPIAFKFGVWLGTH